MDGVEKLGAVGFDKSSMRQFMMWDPRKTDEPFHTMDLDQSAGAIMPFYDNDVNVRLGFDAGNGAVGFVCVRFALGFLIRMFFSSVELSFSPLFQIMYLAGKGDGSIKYFEVNNEAPFIHYIDENRSNEPKKGLAFLPKRCVDTTQCEIARGLRLLTNWIEVVSFQVPRKADTFQKDIYPDTYAGIPSMTSDAWLAGANTAPIMRSLQPGAGGAAAAGGVQRQASFVVSKSAAQEVEGPSCPCFS